MKILFISQLFDPENSIKGLSFIKKLAALGYEVEVITTFPSYPGGKIYPGYRQKWCQVEQVDGVRITRLPTYISHGQSSVRRLVSYASFAMIASVYALFRWKRFDLYYVYYPPVVLGVAVAIVGILRGVPFIYDVQDLWPEALVATGNARPGGWIVRGIDGLCSFVYRRAARVVVLSQGYREALVAKGVPRQKIECIYNWCDESRMRSTTEKKTSLLDGEYFNFLYAGNLGSAQALEHVITAAECVWNTGFRNIRFVFLGTGIEETKLRSIVLQLQLNNVQFLPRVSVDEVSGYLSSADVLLVHLADDPVFRITIPQKVQAYLMAGRPILVAVSGEAGSLVERAGAGVSVDSCAPEQLALAAIQMSKLSSSELNMMASRGAAFYRDHMSMECGVSSIDQLFKSVRGHA